MIEALKPMTEALKPDLYRMFTVDRVAKYGDTLKAALPPLTLKAVLDGLETANAIRWRDMTIDPNRLTEFRSIAGRLAAAKPRYAAIAAATGVPWPVVAVIHEREASQSWSANLAQGDPWNAVSTHVPRGEGPFKSWEAAAIHALTLDDHMDDWGRWTIGGALTALEKYNGTGYYSRAKPSPYVWAGTNQYKAGKYVADGQYDPNYVDHQPGCAALLLCMMASDATIGVQLSWAAPDHPLPVVDPPVTNEWVQDTLNRLGADPKLNVDGDIGPKTVAMIRAFQRRVGLNDDGRVGPATIAALKKALADIGNVPTPPPPKKRTPDEIAAQIVKVMRAQGYNVSAKPREYTIAYVEGWDPDGTGNGNVPNYFDSARFLIQANPDGTAQMLGAWDATTEPSKYWTENPMNEGGAARVCFGQHKAWRYGDYHGAPALRQATNLPVQRDINKTYKRYGPIETGMQYIHHHGGYNYPKNDEGRSSAGCLVGRLVDGHQQFMDIVVTDARYIADKNYLFETAIMPSSLFDTASAVTNKGTMLILRGINNQLDEPSALEYAKRTGYVGRVLDASGETGGSSVQTVLALAAIHVDQTIAALYGFSGGGYNVRHILDRATPAEKARIKTVVVLGAPNNPQVTYLGPWELVYRVDPPGGHMDGPRALLAELPASTS